MRQDSNETLALEGADLEACRRVALWGLLERVFDLQCDYGARDVITTSLPAILKRSDLVDRLGEPGEPNHRYSRRDLPEEEVELLRQVAEEMRAHHEDELALEHEPELVPYLEGRLARAERVLRLLSP